MTVYNLVSFAGIFVLARLIIPETGLKAAAGTLCTGGSLLFGK